MPGNLVIIPTYNEEENIEKIIEAISSLELKFDILVIDDNSPDGTGDIVENLMQQYKNLNLINREAKLGLGTAYITGFKWAIERGYDIIYEMDADFSHNPDDLMRLHDTCMNGVDLAIGSRYISGVNVVNWPLGRVIMSYMASIYVRMVTGLKVKDTTAGFKAYKREVLETIDLDNIRSRGYAFQIEMKFTTWKFGFRIKEIPIIFTERQEGASKMSGGIFNEALWGVLKMKLRSYFRNYRREEVK
jgi:dolichol-phosphate mannosyltransferase